MLQIGSVTERWRDRGKEQGKGNVEKKESLYEKMISIGRNFLGIEIAIFWNENLTTVSVDSSEVRNWRCLKESVFLQ